MEIHAKTRRREEIEPRMDADERGFGANPINKAFEQKAAKETKKGVSALVLSPWFLVRQKPFEQKATKGAKVIAWDHISAPSRLCASSSDFALYAFFVVKLCSRPNLGSLCFLLFKNAFVRVFLCSFVV